jgi:phosphomevalonate kinase
MMDRGFSAPGKLFVAGEYSALWGGVARVVAVGPRVPAYARRRIDRRVEVVLEDGRLGGDSTPAGVRWESEIEPRFRFAAHTIDLALRAIGKETTGFSVAFGPSPTSAGRKLGLGGSARAAVLAAEAVRWACESEFDALKLALAAHAEAQGGKGSGADVAAAFGGGFIRYRRFPVEPLLDASRKGELQMAIGKSPPVDIARLPFPRLPMVYAFTGESASTVALVGAVEARRSTRQRASVVSKSDALGDALETALCRGDFPSAKDASLELQSLLDALAPAQSPALERILAIARGLGCAGKQSGAGGGDGALLFAPDQDAAMVLREAFVSRGIVAEAISVQEGVRLEKEPVSIKHWV